MNSICSQGEAPTEKISFVSEIQMMMFGLGDSPNPLLATAIAIEEIVLQQLVSIIGQAEEVSEKRGVDGIYPQDILFLMRKDVHKLNRIINYISFKDVKKNLASLLNEGENPRLEELMPSSLDFSQESKRKNLCVQFLQSIGVNLDNTSTDTIKQERLKREVQRSQTMSHKSFEEYNQSRRSTFLGAKLSASKLTEWLQQNCPDCTPNLKLFSVDLLLYLAKETVAQLVDIALLLRQDANMVPTDPFSRLPQPCLPFETFGSTNKQLEGYPPITVSEIQEVIRRYYSSLLCPWSAFTTDMDPTVFNKILAF